MRGKVEEGVVENPGGRRTRMRRKIAGVVVERIAEVKTKEARNLWESKLNRRRLHRR